MLAFAATLLGCARIAGSGSALPSRGGPKWLSGALLASSAVSLYQMGAFFFGGIQGAGFLMVAMPSAFWFGPLLWSSGSIRRTERTTAPH